tara:strand:+ start:4543 stop:5226 length:684 start_codon:yes stop_codon:yes gene_type:complete
MGEQILRVKFKPGTSMTERFDTVVEYLRQLIEDGLRDQYVRRKAVAIVNRAGIKQHDELGEIEAIVKWVQNNVTYRKDPYMVEYFMTARRILKDVEAGQSAADCDDFVIVAASLLGSLGYPVGAIIVDSNRDGVFNHVMLCTKTMAPTKKYGNKWIVAELIFPNFKLNESVPVSSVYPLIADANTTRAPIHRQQIAGMNSLGSVPSAKQLSGYQHPYSRMLGAIRRR